MSTKSEKKYIVIAEDTGAYANVYKNKLEEAGFTVAVVSEGDKVIPSLKKRAPDLLVLDMIMPNMTGFEILDAMRSDDALKNIRVVVASNLSQDIDKNKANEYGIIDYFVKSDISVADLVANVKNIVGT